MRGKFWLILVILIVVIGGLWFWWKGSPLPGKQNKSSLKPGLAMASMNITDIDPDKVKVISKVVLNNPYPVELKTNRLNYEIFIDSIPVIKSSYDKPIRINSRDSAVIEMPMTILNKPMEQVMKHFEKNKIDSANYTVKAKFDVDVPIAGERTFTINLDKKLPAIRIPKMTPGRIDVDKLGFRNSKLDMVLHVKNPNAFPLKMKDGRYTVVIDNNMKMQGVMEKIVAIPAKGSEDVSMALDIKTSNMGKLAWKSLFNKKDTDFTLDFRCKLLSDNKMLGNSNIAVRTQGTLEELKELVEGK